MYKEWVKRDCRKERGKQMRMVDEEEEDQNSIGRQPEEIRGGLV